MKPTLAEFVSSFSGLGVNELILAARAAPTSYKMYRKPKRKGGERVIFHPAKRTKTLQYLLMRTVLSRLPIHPCAMAYRKGLQSPLLVNATRHAANAYLLKVDFEDFFPSIKPNDLLSIIHVIKKDAPFRVETADEQLLSNALFVRYPNGKVGLAIGAPSSPLVSNAVMASLDKEFQAMAEKHGAIFTRYADDLTFSTADKGGCAKLLSGIKATIMVTASPELVLHPKKTRLLSRKSRRPITGLIVACDGKVSIGRKNKRKVRSLLFRFKNGRATGKEKKFLRGYLAFVRDVDPAFMDWLLVHFGIDLINQARAA